MALPLASIQLYTLAEQFSADMGGSLDRLAALGLRNVEAFDFVRRPAEVRARFLRRRKWATAPGVSPAQILTSARASARCRS